MLGAGGMRAGAVNRICIGCGGSHGTRAGEVTLDGRRTWREVVCSAAGGAKCGLMRDERRTLVVVLAAGCRCCASCLARRADAVKRSTGMLASSMRPVSQGSTEGGSGTCGMEAAVGHAVAVRISAVVSLVVQWSN